MARAWNFKDRTGDRYGRLTVISFKETRGNTGNKKKSYWICQCDCGVVVEVSGSSLQTGSVQSCGCYHRDRISETKTTHGLTESTTYKSWLSMKERCTNPNSNSYKSYGAKGIKVCQEWLESFEKFLEDMGERPNGTTLNRKGSADTYCKENCEWSTLSVQGFDQKKNITNTSGKTGVAPTKNGKWVAYIDCEKRIHLGTFENFEEAVSVRKEAELKYFGWNKE